MHFMDVENDFGFRQGVLGRELIDRLRKQAERFAPFCRLGYQNAFA